MPGGFFYWTSIRRKPVTPKMIEIPIAGDQRAIDASTPIIGNTSATSQPANPTKSSPMNLSAVFPPGGMRGLARMDAWTINATPAKVPIAPRTATSCGGGDGANICAICIANDVMLEKAKMAQPRF